MSLRLSVACRSPRLRGVDLMLSGPKSAGCTHTVVGRSAGRVGSGVWSKTTVTWTTVADVAVVFALGELQAGAG